MNTHIRLSNCRPQSQHKQGIARAALGGEARGGRARLLRRGALGPDCDALRRVRPRWERVHQLPSGQRDHVAQELRHGLWERRGGGQMPRTGVQPEACCSREGKNCSW